MDEIREDEGDQHQHVRNPLVDRRTVAGGGPWGRRRRLGAGRRGQQRGGVHHDDDGEHSKLNLGNTHFSASVSSLYLSPLTSSRKV